MYYITFKINMSLKIIGKVSSKMGYSKTETFKKWINTFQKPEREKKKQRTVL